MSFYQLKNRMARTHGYTIDQTVLIVAIIAILVTIIILSVGLSLLNKAGGSKLASQFNQIEDANSQFFANFKVWPVDAKASASVNESIAFLKGAPAITGMVSAVTGTEYVDQLPGFSYAASATAGAAGTTTHNMGSGGVIVMQKNVISAANNPAATAGTAIVVQFQSVPLADAKAADLAIDNTANATQGRVVYSDSATNCINTTNGGTMGAVTAGASSLVRVCYIANRI